MHTAIEFILLASAIVIYAASPLLIPLLIPKRLPSLRWRLRGRRLTREEIELMNEIRLAREVTFAKAEMRDVAARTRRRITEHFQQPEER